MLLPVLELFVMPSSSRMVLLFFVHETDYWNFLSLQGGADINLPVIVSKIAHGMPVSLSLSF